MEDTPLDSNKLQDRCEAKYFISVSQARNLTGMFLHYFVYLEMGFDMYVPSQSDGNATDDMVRYHNIAENLVRDAN